MTATDRFDRLAPTGPDGAPTRGSVIDYFETRFGMAPSTFDEHTFWRKGADAVWAVAGNEPGPVGVQTLGLRLLRTGGHDWKPTTDGIQRFYPAATRNVLTLDRERARRFVRGEGQAVTWAGDRGYLIVVARLADTAAPLGVGLYTDGVLRSQIPKARQFEPIA